MVIYLAASLSGCAQAVLADLDSNWRRSYQALREVLSLRFDNGGKMKVFRSQLKSCIRGKDESLPELAQAIQRLVRQVYPEAALSVREVLEKDYFVDAIADTDIRWKILQTRPGTIQEVLAMATEVEAFRISEHQRLRPGRLTANLVGAQVSDKQRDTLDTLDPSISKTVSEMKKDREEKRRLMENLMKKIERPVWSVLPGMELASSWGPRHVVVGNCWNLGKPGHFFA